MHQLALPSAWLSLALFSCITSCSLRSTFRCILAGIGATFFILSAHAPQDETDGEPRCWLLALPVRSVWLSFHFLYITSFCSCPKHPIYNIVQRCAHFSHFAEMFTLRRALLCSHHTCSLTLMHAFLFLLAVKEYAGKDMQAHWNHTRRRALWRYQVCRFQQSPYQCREESWIGRASSNGAGSAVDGCNAYSFIQRGQDHLHWCKKASTGA
jgi:hypothetical protein